MAANEPAPGGKQQDGGFKSYGLREHVEKKGMWAGATKRVNIPALAGAFWGQHKRPDGEIEKKCVILPIENDHTPALLKAFDELLVNASDHAKGCRLTGSTRKYSQVTYVNVVFEPTRGTFTIENDGPGIPIVRHEQQSVAKKRDVYIPEVAFCCLLSGTNMDKEKDPSNIKGGINGVGAKIANIHANHFRFETVSEGLLYSQRCHNRMTVIDPPEISKATSAKNPLPHTTVQMLPAYQALGYGAVGAPSRERSDSAENPRADCSAELSYPSDWTKNYQEILAWLRLRCCQLAAYLGDRVTVRLNGGPIPYTSATHLAKLLIQTRTLKMFQDGKTKKGVGFEEIEKEFQIFETQLKSTELPYKLHPWSVTAVISPHIKGFTHVSIINGVVTSAGSHLPYIKELFKEGTLKSLHGMTKDKSMTTSTTVVCSHMMLVVVGAFPGAEWTGQRKDELTAPRPALKKYTFPATWMKTIAPVLSAGILRDAGAGKKIKKPKQKLDKYTKATSAGRGSSAKLLVAEGDSAITLLRDGLTLGSKNPGGPTYREYGVYSLGGVPLNAAKKVTVVQGEDGEDIIVQMKKLKEHKVLNGLVYVLGLDFGCKYETAAERAQLNYCKLVACVDQDVDGAGKILGILLTFFHIFWPNLIKHGFIQWFMTPIVRIYPHGASTEAQRAKTGPLHEFYHEQEYLSWAEEKQDVAGQYLVRYYKGLGGHDSKEVPAMFRDFSSRLYTLTLDDGAAELFDIYFGKEADKRRAELSTPLVDLDVDQIRILDETRQISCSMQLKTFGKAYKLDALERQLPGALDGLTIVRRKALAAARLRFGNKNAECKTFQLAGFTADKMSYHHGSASVEGAIIKMCQTFAGSRQIPFLLGSGSFGSRFLGGDDAASPRYTSVTLNKQITNVLFPPEDDYLLPYSFVDGARAEPHSYVPVVPLIDTLETPSEGWNVRIWARRLSQVINITRAFCDTEHPYYRLVRTFVDYDEAARKFGEARLESSEPRDPFITREQLLAKLKQVLPLDIALQGTTGELRTRRGKLHQYGRYQLRTAPDDEEGARGALIVITDLPLRMWPGKYAASLMETASGTPTARAKYISQVDDYSGGDTVNIAVALRPGALSLIRQKYGQAPSDPIEHFLGLYTSLWSKINVIRPSPSGGGGVISLEDDYHRLVLYGLPFRRKYYRLRYERKELLLRLLIRVEKEILRYIELNDAETFSIARIEDERLACEMLASKNFPRVRLQLLKAPKYASLEEIRGAVVEASVPLDLPEAGGEGSPSTEEEGAGDGRANYNYILNLRERDLLRKAYSKRAEKLKKMEEELQEIVGYLGEQPFAAASIWRKEIDEVVRALKEQSLYD